MLLGHAANASIAGTFERLLSAEELDQGLAAVHPDSWAPPASHGVAPTDLGEVRSLFSQLAANHVRQVRDFVIDLRWSEATVDWVGHLRARDRHGHATKPPTNSSSSSASAALDAFSQALMAAQTTGLPVIDRRSSGRPSSPATMPSCRPHAGRQFAPSISIARNESCNILQSLLLQVPSVRKVTIDKLYAAGLTTLEALLLATPDDIAQTTGIQRHWRNIIVTGAG